MSLYVGIRTLPCLTPCVCVSTELVSISLDRSRVGIEVNFNIHFIFNPPAQSALWCLKQH